MASGTQGSRSKDVPYYTAELAHLDSNTRTILEQYSQIPPEDVIPHVLRVRDLGWDVFSYPCIGQFRFLDLSLGQAKQYPEVLQRVKNGQRLLDMGCCFGQDIRRLVYDGAPDNGANLFGMDLEQEFFDLGYDLFRDKGRLQSKFVSADIFAPSSPLDELGGTVDVIHASSFFHLFDWDQQVQVATKVVQILKPGKGSLILGRHMGNEPAGHYSGTVRDGMRFRHDEASWRKMWDQISTETGTNWNVTFEWDDQQSWTRASNHKWAEPGARPMRYAVWRE